MEPRATIAALVDRFAVSLAFVIAWIMVGIPLSQLLLKFGLYQLHKSAGICGPALTLPRLVVRSRRGRPAWDTDLPSRQQRSASAVHARLYMLLLVTPVLGYFTGRDRAGPGSDLVPGPYLDTSSYRPGPCVVRHCATGPSHCRHAARAPRLWAWPGSNPPSPAWKTNADANVGSARRYQARPLQRATRDRHRPAPSGGTAP